MIVLGGRPGAENPEEARRWAEAERRRRILSGDWKDLLKKAAQRRLGRKRLRGIGELEVSQNALEYLCRELAVLYEYEPGLNNGQPGDILTLRTELRLMNLWGFLSEVQYFTLGLRNMLVRVDIEGEGAESQAYVRMVFPDHVHVDVMPTRPSQPVAVREWRLRTIDGVEAWYLDDISVADPKNPFYRVWRYTGEGGRIEVTKEVLGGEFVGETYPYRDDNGRALLPYVAYHARQPAQGFWRGFELSEVVEGTLSLAVCDGFVVHVMIDAGHPQRWAANVRVVGAEPANDDGGERQEIVTDPATLLMFESDLGADDERGPMPIMVGQFQPGGDPEMLNRTLESRKAALVTAFGVPPGDLLRTSGEGGVSGVALALSNEGKRAAQRRSANVHRDSDQRLVRLIACLLNHFRGDKVYAEWGYSISYTELPLSPQERMARQQEIEFQTARGLMSKLQAYLLLHPGLSEEDAKAALAAIRDENNGAAAPTTGGTNGQ